MAEMSEIELLQQLKEEFKTLELMFNKGIDRMLKILKETRKDPKDLPPNTPPNSSPYPIYPPIQTQPSQTIVQNIATYSAAKRPKTWPNKPPKLAYFIRPKPWPDEPPINIVPKPRTSSTIEVMSQNLRQAKERKPYQYQYQYQHLPQVRAKFVGRLRSFQVADRNWDLFQHRNLHTFLRSTATTTIEAIKPFLAVHLNPWTIAILPASFPGINRPRSRPKNQLMVSLMLEPGGNDSFEEVRVARLRFRWSFGHFERNFKRFRQRIKERSRRFSERRRIENDESARVHCGDSRAIEDLGFFF
ncbi:hypothetical protein Ddye_025953 [Dipteronia dyeriana]|uniref:Uncharacterized protein n=1 Tax=Dipteronia dyeriana TaxID=168575 RepID=A0AAD9TLR3_9ROSI|nr:hypothetical protein Ddye_025953 [Dipteronia dyeriana]